MVEIDQASYFPYNQNMQERRLDYVCTRRLLADTGAVLPYRDLARSDHEAIVVPILTEVPKAKPSPQKTWGTRRLKAPTKVAEMMATYEVTATDPIELIANIARLITALKVLEQDDYWRGQLLHVFNDMLYTARIPANIENGITVLLAKMPSPGDWSDTRPITLSSTLLRSFSQLIIGRASHCVQGDSRLQWARRSRQGVELILVIRRLCRVAHDWGLPMYLAKLDIRKAFDSIYQEALAEQIEEDVRSSLLTWNDPSMRLFYGRQLSVVYLCSAFTGNAGQ
ncbi:unnamed protein product, partial [Symbiodinium necroappetens]